MTKVTMGPKTLACAIVFFGLSWAPFATAQLSDSTTLLKQDVPKGSDNTNVVGTFFESEAYQKHVQVKQDRLERYLTEETLTNRRLMMMKMSGKMMMKSGMMMMSMKSRGPIDAPRCTPLPMPTTAPTSASTGGTNSTTTRPTPSPRAPISFSTSMSMKSSMMMKSSSSGMMGKSKSSMSMMGMKSRRLRQDRWNRDQPRNGLLVLVEEIEPDAIEEKTRGLTMNGMMMKKKKMKKSMMKSMKSPKQKNNKKAASPAPFFFCEPEVIDIVLEWTNTTSGLVADGGFTISDDGLTVRFDVEDSDDACGSVNGNTQQGTATSTLTLTEDAILTAVMDGMAEPFSSGQESMTVTINNLLIAYGESQQIRNPQTCAPVPINVLERSARLSPGIYPLEITVTTNDERFHSGVFFEVQFQLEPL